MLKPCHDQYNAIHQIHLYFCQYEVPDLFGFPYLQALGMRVVKKVDRPEYKVSFSHEFHTANLAEAY
jgi:hypothetical protein